MFFCASQSKLQRSPQSDQDIGLVWNEKKCTVMHINKGVLDGTTYDDTQRIDNLKDGDNYKFLGILENTKQEDNMVLEAASNTYQQRLSVIWSSPLSDFHKLTAINKPIRLVCTSAPNVDTNMEYK